MTPPEDGELIAELAWIAGFADLRSKDDSKVFARVNRGALRTIAEKAASVLARLQTLGGGRGSYSASPSSGASAPELPAARDLGEPAEPLIWEVCEYLRDAAYRNPAPCKHCPSWEMDPVHGWVQRGCYAEAREVVNIAQTGNPWRKAASKLTKAGGAKWASLTENAERAVAIRGQGNQPND